MPIIAHKQLTLAETYDDCSNIFETDKHQFLLLLEEHINLASLIPYSFYNKYYARTGRPRKFSLESMLWILTLQRIFSISEDKQMLLFLRFSKELRSFCDLTTVPNQSRITRFKQDFCDELDIMFHQLVDITEPICYEIDAYKASMTIFDTSGIEAYVTENNPKFENSKIRSMKTYVKSNNLDVNFYAAAYASMPTHAASNEGIKHMYINGHFCYAYKLGLITNGLGIVRNISFYDDDFINAHPDIELLKKTNKPDEDKLLDDTKALIPSLTDFFAKHPSFQPNLFLGDSAFDSTKIYKDLLNDLNFSKAFIPLKPQTNPTHPDCKLNEDGIPCCPNDDSLPMKYECESPLRNGVNRFKFVCPKMKWHTDNSGKSRRKTFCENPCTESVGGRAFYIYPEKDLRLYPGTVRGDDTWVETYKIRTTVERSIHHFKDRFNVAGRKTQNAKTLHADLLLAGITQLLTVVLANKINKPQYIRSIKPLIA